MQHSTPVFSSEPGWQQSLPSAASLHGAGPQAADIAGGVGQSSLPTHRVHVPADEHPVYSGAPFVQTRPGYGRQTAIAHGPAGQISLPDGFSPDSADGKDERMQYHVLLDTATMAPRAVSLSQSLLGFMQLSTSGLEQQLQQRQMSSLLHPQYFTQRLQDTLACHLRGDDSYELASVLLQCCSSTGGAADSATPPHGGTRSYRAYNVTERVKLHKNNAGECVGTSHVITSCSSPGGLVHFHARGGTVLPVATQLLSRIPLAQAQAQGFAPLDSMHMTSLHASAFGSAFLDLHRVAGVHEMIKAHREKPAVVNSAGLTHILFESAATADSFLPLFRVVNVLTAFSAQSLESALVVQSLLTALPTQVTGHAQRHDGLATQNAHANAAITLGGDKRSRVESQETSASSESSKRARAMGVSRHGSSDSGVQETLFASHLGASLGFPASAPVTIGLHVPPRSLVNSSGPALQTVAHTVASQALHPVQEAPAATTPVALSELPRIPMDAETKGTGLPDGGGLFPGGVPSLVSTAPPPNMSFGGMPAVEFANSLNGAMSALIRVASEGVEEGGAWDMPLLRLGSAHSTHAPEGQFSLDSPRIDAAATSATGCVRV